MPYSFKQSAQAVTAMHPHIRIVKSSWVAHGKVCECACTRCGTKFYKIPSALRSYQRHEPCPGCQQGHAQRKFSLAESRSQVARVCPTLKISSKTWTGHNQICKMKCDLTGDIFEFTPQDVITYKGRCPCPGCKRARQNKPAHNAITKDEAQRRLSKRFPTLQIQKFSSMSKPCLILNTVTGLTLTEYSVSQLLWSPKKALAQVTGLYKNMEGTVWQESIASRSLRRVSSQEKLHILKHRLGLRFNGDVMITKLETCENSMIGTYKHVCGHVWSSNVFNTLHSKVGCPECGRRQAQNKTRMSGEAYQKLLDTNTKGSVIALQPFKSETCKIMHGCVRCGSVFVKWVQQMKGYKRAGCPVCTSMNSSAYSYVALQWLKDIETNLGVKLQHALNGKEFKIGSFNVDGYHKETRTVFEFLGDDWHGNPKKHKPDHIGPSGASTQQLYAQWLDRSQTLYQMGFNVVAIWESDYYAGLPYSSILVGNQQFLTF